MDSERQIEMFYSIDRFEGNFAVLIADDESQKVIGTECIPQEAKEGSILFIQDGKYLYDAEETARRRKEFFMRTKKLSKK